MLQRFAMENSNMKGLLITCLEQYSGFLSYFFLDSSHETWCDALKDPAIQIERKKKLYESSYIVVGPCIQVLSTCQKHLGEVYMLDKIISVAGVVLFD
jgi:hypothetical protein